MSATQPDSEAANVAEELRQQVSLASDLLAEQRWARAGEALSVIQVNDKIIEEKEKELVDCIAQNYSRIKGVERELAGLQLQLKLTSGPKKSALELLRRKIELQNEKVVLARGKFQAARKIAEAADEALKAEEGVKEQLCQELNLLVQQSAHAQLERLEQLTKRMELLNKGFIPADDADLEAAQKPANGRSVPSDEAAGPPPADAQQAEPVLEQRAPNAVALSPDRGNQLPEASVPEVSAADQPAPKLHRGVQHSPRRPETTHIDQERAAAARARHVPLKSFNKPVPAGKAQVAKLQKAPNQPFQGFD